MSRFPPKWLKVGHLPNISEVWIALVRALLCINIQSTALKRGWGGSLQWWCNHWWRPLQLRRETGYISTDIARIPVRSLAGTNLTAVVQQAALAPVADPGSIISQNVHRVWQNLKIKWERVRSSNTQRPLSYNTEKLQAHSGFFVRQGISHFWWLWGSFAPNSELHISFCLFRTPRFISHKLDRLYKIIISSCQTGWGVRGASTLWTLW